MKKYALTLSMLFMMACSFAQENILWMRYPAISPDGTQIAFGYKGDLYLVAAAGGIATPLTIHESHDMMPVWSHDGKSIAFASDRYGNFDVFIMPVSGGIPKRLSNHSAADYPQDFTPDDQSVLFTSARCISNTNVRFYSPRLFQNLYTVNKNGGKANLITEAGMSKARYNTDGSMIVFQDRKGYEDALRKHHTSSVTRDIWTLDLKNMRYHQISTFKGEDTDPVFIPGTNATCFISEQGGTLNIYKSENGVQTAITRFKTHPVRHLSISDQQLLCFTYNGDLYTQTMNGEAQKISVAIRNDGRAGTEKNMAVNSGIGQFALAHSGKEIAFVNRGEVFVTSVEGTQTKRITNTPQQERYVQWSPDGRSLLYASERNESWDIYQASISRKDEPYFYAATLISETPLIAGSEEEFQGKYSPDGKHIAYIAERNSLKVYNIATKESEVLLPTGRNFSYSDGDWDFAWSPDSKFILCDDGEGNWFSSSVALIKNEENSSIVHPMASGYGQGNVNE